MDSSLPGAQKEKERPLKLSGGARTGDMADEGLEESSVTGGGDLPRNKCACARRCEGEDISLDFCRLMGT